MFEQLVDTIVSAAKSLTEMLREMLKSFAEFADTVLGKRELTVYQFSVRGYGEAAGLPERKTSSIIEFHSAPIS